MKIHVEFDLTPTEFRQAMGLPDVESFQRELMSRIQQQMEAGVEGYDPWSLMQPFMQQGLTQGMASFGNYQQMMLDMMRKAGTGHRSETSEENGAKETNDKRRSSASATSRQARKS
ncbi:DUF6489 family protein [Modicisalibacter xianhensis]|uniref:Uncharacterized protein n=1 Tax=Modicisalibacter xianhensis TaxID=442341 RepID=A0A1I3BNX3_9GAMM|nr:DUF6489 family protein [Halomonas xianhensis]SFH64044.1 hypothetical protein SAMN04487959_10722 [Halomonas xianhensis]